MSAGRYGERTSPFGQLQAQITLTRRATLGALALGAAVLGGVIAIHLLRDVAFESLTRDIFAITGYPVYFGIVSNIGLVGWVVAATLWLAATCFVRLHRPGHELSRLALASGIASVALLLDDALMLHETLLPIALGVSEDALMVGYGAAALAYACATARAVWRTPYLPWLLAGGFFAGSLAIDLLEPAGDVAYLLEDGLKFAGIVCWATYTALTSLQIVESCRSERA